MLQNDQGYWNDFPYWHTQDDPRHTASPARCTTTLLIASTKHTHTTPREASQKSHHIQVTQFLFHFSALFKFTLFFLDGTASHTTPFWAMEVAELQRQISRLSLEDLIQIAIHLLFEIEYQMKVESYTVFSALQLYSYRVIHLLNTYCIAAWFWIFTTANLRLRCGTCHFGRVELPLRSKGFALAVLTPSLLVLHSLLFVPGGWNLTAHRSLRLFSLLYASLLPIAVSHSVPENCSHCKHL